MFQPSYKVGACQIFIKIVSKLLPQVGHGDNQVRPMGKVGNSPDQVAPVDGLV